MNFENIKSWPFVEACKILKSINHTTPKKGYVLFETGFGPSGLPHIGTFGEVSRTSMVINAFKTIAPEIPTKLICFSDDMDGLRKVPTNIPNQELISQYLGQPLTMIPDPYNEFPSYGEHMNEKLKLFLDQFNFEYEFKSATTCYKSGLFNETLKTVLDNYDQIMSIMLPTLRDERAKTYSPILPICPTTGKVLEGGLISFDTKNYTIKFRDDNGEVVESNIFDGNIKLQWKVDFGHRWHNLGVNYEIYGKDIQPSAVIASKICRLLGSTPAEGFLYELFLDDKGQKISKSKGNGLTIDEWLRYAPQESLSYYMYLKPKTAKRLYFDVIPKAVDDYITHNMKLNESDELEVLVNNPAWHVNHTTKSAINLENISFSLLLNLVSACNPENEDIIWGFISTYNNNLKKNQCAFLDILVTKSINYYQDFILPNKTYRLATDLEKKALCDVKDRLALLIDTNDPQIIQNVLYEIGVTYDIELKKWFKALYQILLGQKQGPRLGSFISLFGVQKTIDLIEEKIAI